MCALHCARIQRRKPCSCKQHRLLLAAARPHVLNSPNQFKGEIRMSNPDHSMPRVGVISLDHGDSAAALPTGDLIQQERFDHLKKQIKSHLDTLDSSNHRDGTDHPMGSGWAQFVDGTRGAGKSTFLNSVKNGLERESEFKGDLAFIDLIDPSRIERSEIMLLVILQHLRVRVDSALKNLQSLEENGLRDEWRQAFKGVAGGLSLFAKDYHPLDDLDPDLFLDWGLERASHSTSLRKKLHRLFATACKILGVKALILAFDDADTDSAHAVNLLECIRKYLDTPRVMVLVTGDLELYSLLVSQHFAEAVTGRKTAAIDLQFSEKQGNRSPQYVSMIDHLEEQYLLKLFPIRRRIQLLPLASVMLKTNFSVKHSAWGDEQRPLEAFVREILRLGMRVKSPTDVDTYKDFLLKQPLRSVLQVLVNCAPHMPSPSLAMDPPQDWSHQPLTQALSRSLQALALSSLFKLSVNIDGIAAQELPALTLAIFDLSIKDGDIDTALYLRPMSADQDIRVSFTALAAEVPNFCAGKPGLALRYLLRGPGSVSLYSLARDQRPDNTTEEEHIKQFVAYMGIGRQEGSLDWARRATAVIGVPYSGMAKTRVILPGTIGLNRRKRNRSNEHTVNYAIRAAVEDHGIFPAFALCLVDVAGATNARTYASIFVLLGFIESLLSVEDAQGARSIFDRGYPTLSVTTPSWVGQSGSDVQNEEEEADAEHSENEREARRFLWQKTETWRESALQLSTDISPSAIFIGKFWTRLFFSLKKASSELRTKANFGEAMEIFALCVINAIMIEEADHHLRLHPAGNETQSSIDRDNPLTSASTFVKKLERMKLQRNDFPLTAMVVTCPLLLGLLDEELNYAYALEGLFPADTEAKEIACLLRSDDLYQLMKKVALAGKPNVEPDQANLPDAPSDLKPPRKTRTSKTAPE
jgi:hypothetical protein